MVASTQRMQNVVMILAGAVYTAFILWLGDTSVFVQALVATVPSVPLLLLFQHRDSPRKIHISSVVMTAGFLGQMLAAIYVYTLAPQGVSASVRYMVAYGIVLVCTLAITHNAWAQ